MRPATRREVLGAGLLAALTGVVGMSVATPDLSAKPIATDERRCRNTMEEKLLLHYRNASDSEKAAMRRLIERSADGDDMHVVGVECMMAFGCEEAEANALTSTALQGSRASRKGDSA